MVTGGVFVWAQVFYAHAFGTGSADTALFPPCAAKQVSTCAAHQSLYSCVDFNRDRACVLVVADLCCCYHLRLACATYNSRSGGRLRGCQQLQVVMFVCSLSLCVMKDGPEC